MPKPDIANHELLIANYIGITYNALEQHLMFNFHEKNDSFNTDILSKQGNSGVTNQG